jgi:hypothetical protein
MPNFYPQSAFADKTWTVGELVAALRGLDPQLPICFAVPQFGAFGSGLQYTVSSADHVKLEREEEIHPASEFENDEGDLVRQETWIEVWEAWEGVVIR